MSTANDPFDDHLGAGSPVMRSSRKHSSRFPTHCEKQYGDRLLPTFSRRERPLKMATGNKSRLDKKRQRQHAVASLGQTVILSKDLIDGEDILLGLKRTYQVYEECYHHCVVGLSRGHAKHKLSFRVLHSCAVRLTYATTMKQLRAGWTLTAEPREKTESQLCTTFSFSS